MSSFASGVAKNNEAGRVAYFDQPGTNLLEVVNKGAAAIVLAMIKASGAIKVLPGDEKYDDEPVYHGDALAHRPIVPGSVVVAVTGVSNAVDSGLDGVLKLDRVIDSVLASGTNGATSGSTLTSAGQDFAAAEVVPGDLVVLKSGVDRGSYTVVTVGTTTLVLDRALPVGGATAVQYTVYAKVASVGTVDYFSGLLSFDYPTSIAPGGKASMLGSVAFPVALSPGDTVIADVDGGGNQVATFDAAHAVLPGSQAATFAASASETLVVEVDGVEQEIDFGAGTETDADSYAAEINTQLVGGFAEANANSLNAMIGTLNEAKADLNAHFASTTIHLIADSTNTITAAAATNLATAQDLANEIKANYNTHRSQAGVHVNNDAGNAVAAPNASDLTTLVTLVADIKAKVNAHLAEVSSLEEAIALLNGIKDEYNKHRVLIAGGVHGLADGTNIVAVADASDLATCLALANDIKAKYEAHRVLIVGNVHTNYDSVNDVTAADATNLATLITLANDLRVQYEAHRVYRGANATGAFGGCAFTDQGGNVCRLTDASNPFGPDDIGKQIVVANSTSGGNDGTFLITNAAAGWVEYTNATLVAEAFAAATTGTIADVHGAADGANIVTEVAVNTNAIHSIDDTVNVITALAWSLELYSDSYGTGSSIEIVSGTGSILAKIGHSVASASGTGDVADIGAVTFAEAKSVLEADIKTATPGDKLVASLDETGYLRLTNTTSNSGASSTLVLTGTARTKFGFDALTHAGDDPDASGGYLVDYTSSTSYAAGSRSSVRVSVAQNEKLAVYAAMDGASGLVEINSD